MLHYIISYILYIPTYIDHLLYPKIPDTNNLMYLDYPGPIIHGDFSPWQEKAF